MQKTVILVRNGECSNCALNRENELTIVGRSQVWNSSLQILEKIDQQFIDNAMFFCLSELIARQTAYVAMAAFAIDPKNLNIILDTEIDNISEQSLAEIHADIVVIFGGTELLRIAQKIRPKKSGYKFGVGSALIMKVEEYTRLEKIEVTPEVSTLSAIC